MQWDEWLRAMHIQGGAQVGLIAVNCPKRPDLKGISYQSNGPRSCSLSPAKHRIDNPIDQPGEVDESA